MIEFSVFQTKTFAHYRGTGCSLHCPAQSSNFPSLDCFSSCTNASGRWRSCMQAHAYTLFFTPPPSLQACATLFYLPFCPFLPLPPSDQRADTQVLRHGQISSLWDRSEVSRGSRLKVTQVTICWSCRQAPRTRAICTSTLCRHNIAMIWDASCSLDVCYYFMHISTASCLFRSVLRRKAL